MQQNIKRFVETQVKKDLSEKLVFLVGPRQVGKTWIAKDIAETYTHPLFLNYDNMNDRARIRSGEWERDVDLLVLDEIHKMRGWKNFVKGFFDTRRPSMHFLVTGSAALNAHKHAGDSMAGRYFAHHIYPITVREMSQLGMRVDVVRLFERGGFPEPFLAEAPERAARWREEYTDSVVREDTISLLGIDNYYAFQNVFHILRTKVGSPISYTNIAQDVGVSSVTVKRYIQILEALYVVFRVQPYTHKISRSILKEHKIYFFDTGLVDDRGARFENMLAVELHAYAKSKRDLEGKAFSVSFLRTRDGNEVDFALVNEKNELLHAIEAKMSDSTPTKALKYFTEKYSVSGSQVLFTETQTYAPTQHIHIRSVEHFVQDVLI